MKNKSGKKKLGNIRLVGIAVVVLAVLVATYILFFQPQSQTNYDSFAKCLTENGLVMAGTDTCHFCQQEKSAFGNSFQFVNYENCATDQNFCISTNIVSTPTWLQNGKIVHVGFLTLQELSQLSGCSLQ
jgi:hypothetical protein